MKLRPIDPEGAYERWDWVRQGIQKAIDNTGAHLRPEDVYTQIRNNTAWLYIIEDDCDLGFVVLTQERDPDGLVLFIWVLWAARGSLWARRSDLDAEIDKLARAVKAKRVRWSSPRRGYERWGYGKPVAVTYERELGV